MRALYLEEIPEGESIELHGDLIHHLVSVVRIQTKEEILLLDGKGLKVSGVIESVSKKNLRIKVIKRETVSRDLNYDLALVVPKKDALELCLKEATELGFSRIYLVRGEYSQIKIPEEDRVKKLLVSALEQSNAAYLPEIQEAGLKDIRWDEYQRILWLDSQSSSGDEPSKTATGRDVLVVGPEAGFSPEERSLLLERKNLERIHLPTPILRTPTAVATGAGLLLQRLLDKKSYEILGS